MIIYHRTKAEFRKDVFEDRIAVIVEEELYKKHQKEHRIMSSEHFETRWDLWNAY